MTRYLAITYNETITQRKCKYPKNSESAVSYTHLDVYKRQVLGTWPNFELIMSWGLLVLHM